MADVEKININSTDYDIADAKALRNKSTATATSFVDTKAGNTTYPTTGENQTNMFVAGYQAQIRTSGSISGVTVVGVEANTASESSTVVGYNASATGLHGTTIGVLSSATSYSVSVGYDADTTASYSVAVGEIAKGQGQYSTAMGYNARANTNSVSIGGYSVANGQNDIAIGRNASVNSSSINYAITVGYGSYVQGNYSIAIGASAGVNASAIDSIAIGNSTRVNMYCSRSIAIGKQATVAQSESVQIGQGTNNNYGSLQFRDWPLVNGSGKIYEERLPDGVQFAVDNIPTVPSDFYYSDDDSKQLAVLYKGETVKDENDDDVLVRDLCYRTKTSYSKPSFWCSWVNDNFVPNENKNLIYIDQEKLFLKLAEISRENIDDDNFAGSYVGGDNSSQDMYFYYDGANQTWSIEFGSDSIETGVSTSPDVIDGITDLREYGIYITGEINLPEEDYEEIFDVEYYAPIYCDGFDYGDNEFTVDYMKFMEQMTDGDWGFGYAVQGGVDSWMYEVDGTTYEMPILPKTYEFNDEEYEDVTIRFEYNFNEDEQEWGWTEYINGDEVWFWEENDFENRFGIIVERDQDVEYIEFTFRPARQITWEQFDPVDASHFCTAAEKTSMQGDINRLRNTSFHLIESATDLNTRTTSGAYWIKASGCTNLPSTSSSSRDMFLFVTRTDANNVKQVLITDYVNKSYGGMNYGTYCSNMYVRTLAGGTWRTWQVILTPDDLMFLPSFDKTKKQVIGHTADLTNITWQEASGGGDIDCGTMS